MYDSMHYDNHMIKEQELFREVERWRERQRIRARQRKMRFGRFLSEPVGHGFWERIHHIRHAVDSAINPHKHSLGAGK